MLGMPASDSVHFVDFDLDAKFRQEFAWLPRRCWLTDRHIWLTQVVVGTVVWPGRGSNLQETRYYDPAEYLMYKLKGISQ